MKSFLRRLGLGFGAALLMAGIGSYLVANEGLRALIVFGDNPENSEWVKKTFQASIPLAALGAGILAFSIVPVRPKAPKAEAPKAAPDPRG